MLCSMISFIKTLTSILLDDLILSPHISLHMHSSPRTMLLSRKHQTSEYLGIKVCHRASLSDSLGFLHGALTQNKASSPV